MPDVKDCIQKRVVLQAPTERVWRAIADSEQFGRWFGVAFDGPFVAGSVITGRVTPTTVDAEVAKNQEPYTGAAFTFRVEEMLPMRRLSFRWHPFAIEPGVDYSGEPTTLVAFELQEVSGETVLTITESGFDGIPLQRRAKAFAANDGGWAAQVRLLSKYLANAGQV